MPLYDYECETCGWGGEKLAAMDQRHAQPCVNCGAVLTLVHRPQSHYKVFQHYFDIGLGEEITSYAQRNRIMRQQSMVARDSLSKGEIAARKDKAMERRKERARRGYLDRKPRPSV